MFNTKREYGQAVKRLQRQIQLHDLIKVIEDMTDDEEIIAPLRELSRQKGVVKLPREVAEKWLSEAVYDQPYMVTKNHLSEDDTYSKKSVNKGFLAC